MTQPTQAPADPATPEPSAEATAPEPVEAPDPVAELRKEVESFKDKALRAHAELDNFRKRAAREKEETRRYANAQLIERLLPVLDNFELGLQAARGVAGGEAIVAGFEMVSRQLGEFLRDNHVEQVPGEGAPFDPSLHEAVSHEPHETVAEGHVVRQLRPGYSLHGRLLRPATVVVSKGAPPS